MKWDDDFKRDLLKVNSYRDFLRRFTSYSGGRPVKISLAELARRCDFSSRSYPRDILTGRRRLTVLAHSKFIRGLKLSKKWASYFSSLAALEEPEIGVSILMGLDASECLERSRKALEKELNIKKESGVVPSIEKFLSIPHGQVIYASVPSLSSKGVSIEEVAARSGISLQMVTSSLKSLTQIGLLENEGQVYRSRDLLRRFDKIEISRIFGSWFSQALGKARAVFSTKSENKNILATSVVFSASRKDLPLIKERIKKSLEDVMIEFEKDSGDEVVNIVLASFPESLVHEKRSSETSC